jgi:hypothetical protein
MGSGFKGWVYWHFFTVTVNYNSSHIDLLLSDVCLANALWGISDRLICTNDLPFITATRSEYKLIVLCSSVLSVAAEKFRTIPLLFCFVVTGIMCLATCYMATTGSLLVVIAGTWFPSRCSAMDVYSGSTIPAFSRHVTISIRRVIIDLGHYLRPVGHNAKRQGSNFVLRNSQ